MKGLVYHNKAKPLEAEMEFISYLADGLMSAAKALIEGYDGECAGESLAVMERAV